MKQIAQHIVVADDEPVVRAALTRALAGWGYRVTAVPDGTEALAVVRAESPSAVLADIMMPNLDGVTLAVMLQAEQPALPVILLTGYVAERDRAFGVADLAVAVLTKPVDLGELRQTLTAALNKA